MDQMNIDYVSNVIAWSINAFVFFAVLIMTTRAAKKITIQTRLLTLLAAFIAGLVSMALTMMFRDVMLYWLEHITFNASVALGIGTGGGIAYIVFTIFYHKTRKDGDNA